MMVESSSDGIQNGKGCVIIPGYMEEGRIGAVVAGVLKYCKNVIVIDDGSTDGTSVEAGEASAVVIKHDINKGKGVSLADGFKYAHEHGFEFVITMDADGQHDPEDLPAFLEAYAAHGMPVIIGNRMADPDGMPLIRRWTNLFMSWLLSRRMGQWVPDTQCGYRLYKSDLVAGIKIESGRFAAESEILLYLADEGVCMGSVPVKVIYRDEKSKIHPFRDTIRFFAMMRKYDSMKQPR